MASKENDQKTETTPAAESKKAIATEGKKADEKLMPLPVLADAAGIPAWELAALQKGAGWADGKVVTATEFGAALVKFRARPQGGGRI